VLVAKDAIKGERIYRAGERSRVDTEKCPGCGQEVPPWFPPIFRGRKNSLCPTPHSGVGGTLGPAKGPWMMLPRAGSLMDEQIVKQVDRPLSERRCSRPERSAFAA